VFRLFKQLTVRIVVCCVYAYVHWCTRESRLLDCCMQLIKKTYCPRGMLNRLSSFVRCPSDGDTYVSPVLLANAGFEYTGPGDRARCPTCLVTVDGWRSNGLRSPKDEHRLRSPRCRLMLACCSQSDLPDTDNRFEPAATGSNNAPITTVTQSLRNSANCPVTDAVENRTRTVNSASSASLPVDNRSVLMLTTVTAGSSAHCGTLTNKTSPIDRSNPDYDRMKDESDRLMTYVGWPSTAPVQPPDLAADGWFYSGQSDRVFCAFCRGTLHRWARGDTPSTEHRRHYPDCRFVKGLDVGNVPLVSKKQTTLTEATSKTAMASGKVERWLADSASLSDVVKPEATMSTSPDEPTLNGTYFDTIDLLLFHDSFINWS